LTDETPTDDGPPRLQHLRHHPRLIATERVHRVSAALGGVAAIALVGVVDTRTAFSSADSGIDWNVIFLLFGMMIIVGVLKQTGLFDYLAVWAAQRSRVARSGCWCC
jgi:Na+/H+ antiporter NhaD/arsenite permease-like protein